MTRTVAADRDMASNYDLGRSTSSSAPTLVWAAGDAFVAYDHGLVGTRWTGVPGSEQLTALVDAHRAARTHTGEVLVVNDILRITGPTALRPRAYDQMVRLIEESRGSTRAVAHVVEVPGPIGAAVRAFLDGVERVVGTAETRTRTFSEPDRAASWLSGVSRHGASRAPELTASWRAMQRLAAESAWAA